MDRREFIVVSTGSVVITASAPSVKAENSSPNYEYDDSIIWQGQPLTATGDAIEPEEEYDLYVVESIEDGVVTGSLEISGLGADTNGVVTIETDDLAQGEYFLTGGELPEQPSSDHTFEVTVQTLDVDFGRDTVEHGLATSLEIDSNRGSYQVDVTSDDISEAGLTTLFGEDSDFDLADDQPSDPDTIRLKEFSDRTEEITFNDHVPTGILTLGFSVRDTTANENISVTVEEGDRNVEVGVTDERIVESDEEFSIPISIAGASNGISSYSFGAKIDETEVAVFRDLGFASTHTDSDNIDTSVSDDELSVSVSGAEYPYDYTVTIGSIALIASDRDTIAYGELTLSDVVVEDSDGEPYDVTVSNDSTTIVVDRPTHEIVDMDGVVWQGQVAVDDTERIEPNKVYNLRRAESIVDGQVSSSSFISEIDSGDEGRIEIDTGDFEAANYFLTDHSEEMPQQPLVGDTFEVRIQELWAEFGVGQVEMGEPVELAIESDRTDEYPVLVSARDELEEDVLVNAFVDHGDFELRDPHFGRERTIELIIPGSVSGDVVFEGIESGAYHFDFETRVTEATTTANIAVDADPVPDGPFFSVEITGPEDGAEIDHDQSLLVTAEITNTGSEGGEKVAELTEPEDQTSNEIALEPTESASIDFAIPATRFDEGEEITISVSSEDDSDTVTVNSSDPCFIATAAYDTPAASEIDVLRDFRDDVLKQTWAGGQFVDAYYTMSPPIADWVRATPRRRRLVRECFVSPLVSVVKSTPTKHVRSIFNRD